jgi:hypothetical protein
MDFALTYASSRVGNEEYNKPLFMMIDFGTNYNIFQAIQ